MAKFTCIEVYFYIRGVFMPDNLRITAPVTTTDGINKSNQAAQSPLINPAIPSKVTRPNGNGKGKDLDGFLLEENSVFNKFIARLKETPTLDRTLEKIVSAACAESLLPEEEAAGQAAPMRDFAAQVAVKQEDMLENLLFQQENATAFSDELFQLFKEISNKSGDPQLDLRLADFLKAFDGYFSAEDTTKAIAHNLREIQKEIPVKYSKQLKLLSDKIVLIPAKENTAKNLAVLKKEIIPYLGKYVAKTNDYGKARGNISLLMHDVSELEASTKSGLADKFEKLVSYCKYNLRLPGGTLDIINSFFASAAAKNLKNPDNKFFSSLISLISYGAKDGAGSVDKTVFRDLCMSLLLDNSVYMPFTHIYLPANFQGKSMFAQIWVEKGKDEAKTTVGMPEKRTRLYLTFDIQDLGYFEAEINLAGKHVEVSINCPEKLKKYGGKITPEISGILDKNGFQPGDIKLAFGQKPVVNLKIADMINERKRMIDVSV